MWLCREGCCLLTTNTKILCIYNGVYPMLIIVDVMCWAAKSTYQDCIFSHPINLARELCIIDWNRLVVLLSATVSLTAKWWRLNDNRGYHGADCLTLYKLRFISNFEQIEKQKQKIHLISTRNHQYTIEFLRRTLIFVDDLILISARIFARGTNMERFWIYGMITSRNVGMAFHHQVSKSQSADGNSANDSWMTTPITKSYYKDQSY